MTDEKKDFIESELKNNDIISEGVEAWSKQILTRSIGEVTDEHVAHTLLNKPTDKQFYKKVKAGRVIVEDCLNRWISCTSSSAIVAKSPCRSKIKEMDGRRFLLLQIEISKENESFDT